MKSFPQRFAFVLPRYGAGFAGGAEFLSGRLAEKLAERGSQVEIWTTCARDNRTWANELPAGQSREGNLDVHRFPVDSRNLEAWIPLQLKINDGFPLSVPEQLTWIRESVNSLPLYEHIVSHAAKYNAVFFAPYLFGTTFWGSRLTKDNAVLIPCLHDESYAYLDIIAEMFRTVRGCVFNARAEQELTKALYGPIEGGAVGMGFEMLSPAEICACDDSVPEPRPYLLYLGRKETGKNCHLLIDYFCRGKDEGWLPAELALVVAGGGSFADLHRPEALARGDIVDVEHVSEEEKRRWLRHAVCLVQPSTNESFSIVMMEAWRLETPVLVHGRCPVTREHVVESGGGLYFSDERDFAGTVRFFLEHSAERRRLGRAGRAYVAERYNWAAVLDRFDAVMSLVLSRSAAQYPSLDHKQEMNPHGLTSC